MKISEVFNMNEGTLLSALINHVFGEEFDDMGKAELEDFFLIDLPNDCSFISIDNNKRFDGNVHFSISQLHPGKNRNPSVLMTKLRIQVNVETQECKFFNQ